MRSLVAERGGIADVGSGHGLLAASLAAEGRTVIATERTPAALAELRRCLERDGSEAGGDRRERGIDLRRGEGLAPILPGEVETVVIAGLGGRSMLRILVGAAWLPPRLVLQPQSDLDVIEAWVADRGLPAQRILVTDRGREYVALGVDVDAAPAPAIA